MDQPPETAAPWRKPIVIAVLLLGVMAGLWLARSSRSRPGGKVLSLQRTRIIMGTEVTVTLFASDAAEASEAAEAAFAKMQLVERLMSAYGPESELSKVNAMASQESVAVSPETFDVLVGAGDYYRLSEGAFDVTVMPLVKLWTAASEADVAPSEELLGEALSRVGYEAMALDPASGGVRFLRPAMGIALGAIAKGYAVDLALGALRDAGVTSAIIDAGGDIGVVGCHPEGRPWLVGVRNPFRREAREMETLRLTDSAVATSGDYERFYTINGQRYSHIFDPRTGRPVPDAHSVTVVAPSATAADALSTTASVLGPDRGIALIETLPDTECLFISGSAESPSRRESSGFRALIEVRGQ